MQSNIEKLKTRKYLVISLLVTGFVLLLANIFGENIATLTSDWLNFLVTGVVVALSVIAVIKIGIKGNHGKAWLFFAVCMGFWFIAERIWMVNELVYKIKPWPSEADFFWLAGYPLYYIFSILYIRPFKNSITKKILIPSMLVPIVILIPALYLTIENDSVLNTYEKILDASYPISDAISLVPAVIGICLFFKGDVNFSWSMLLFGVLSFVVSDFGYLYLTLGNLYYTGNPIDIPYIWAYVLFSFGVYSNLGTFKRRSKESAYNDQEKLR